MVRIIGVYRGAEMPLVVFYLSERAMMPWGAITLTSADRVVVSKSALPQLPHQLMKFSSACRYILLMSTLKLRRI